VLGNVYGRGTYYFFIDTYEKGVFLNETLKIDGFYCYDNVNLIIFFIILSNIVINVMFVEYNLETYTLT